MSTPAPRPRCSRCQRPLSHCLCPHIPRLASRSQVLVLQHPDESKHPLNTARLAVLGLQRAELWVGEHFPALVSRLAEADAAALLFPAQADRPELDQPTWAAAQQGLLLVPDGTWRNVRALLRANPCLDTLPRLSLPADGPSDYRIRRSREPHAVSTIEAITRALSRLEPERDFQALLAPFHVMVEQQIQAIGPELYQRNYLSQPR